MARKYWDENNIYFFLLIAYHFTLITKGVPTVCYCHKSGTGLTKCRKWTITPQSCYGDCVYTVDIAIESATVTIKATTIAWRKHVDWPFTTATLQVEKTRVRVTEEDVYYIDMNVLLENTPLVKFSPLYVGSNEGISHFFMVVCANSQCKCMGNDRFVSI